MSAGFSLMKPFFFITKADDNTEEKQKNPKNSD